MFTKGDLDNVESLLYNYIGSVPDCFLHIKKFCEEALKPSHNNRSDEIALLQRQQDAILASVGDIKENVRLCNEIEERIAQLRAVR